MLLYLIQLKQIINFHPFIKLGVFLKKENEVMLHSDIRIEDLPEYGAATIQQRWKTLPPSWTFNKCILCVVLDAI